MVGELRLLIPLAGLIDKEQELSRLTREVNKLEPEIEKLAAKLANAGFVSKAPAQVVEKEKEKLAGMRHTLQELKIQFEKISAL